MANSNLRNNTFGLQDILDAVNALPDAGEETPSVELATPSISVDTGGKITASITQQAGKVAAGTKTATKQLTVQGAQTITPGTTDKTIASGRYLTGTQTIKGDANLKPENIVSGVSIFNVAGTAQTGGGTGVPESCTVEFNIFSNTATTSYLALFWDEPDPRYIPGAFENTDTVVKNSLVAVYAPYVYGYDWDRETISVVGENSDYNFFVFFVYGDGYIHVG